MPAEPGPAVRPLDHLGDGVHAVVIAGGRARRFGRDKTRVLLADRTLLEHVVAAVPAGVPVLAVGPTPPDDDGAHALWWVREEPPLGGPVAALAAACGALPAGVAIVLVLAADQPFAGAAVPRLLAALTADTRAEAAVGLDPGGRRQPLLAAYRRAPLARAVGHRPAGRALRDVLAALHVVEVPVTGREAFDVDRPEDLAVARSLLAQEAGEP